MKNKPLRRYEEGHWLNTVLGACGLLKRIEVNWSFDNGFHFKFTTDSFLTPVFTSNDRIISNFKLEQDRKFNWWVSRIVVNKKTIYRY